MGRTNRAVRVIKGYILNQFVKSALTVAGSDSGGGAGIQADIKSFAAVGVHGCSVLTCITSQNTRGVSSIYPLPPKEIKFQLKAVLSDFDIGAAKTGMLYSADIVRIVAERLRKCDFPIVIDPVMVATVGNTLQNKDFKGALVQKLIPIARLVTPNLYEASQLSNINVNSLDEMKKAAIIIHGLGADAVLIKGGHMRGKLIDLYYDGKRFHELIGYRYPFDLHGSGCTLAASIAAYLACGKSLITSVREAQKKVSRGFQKYYRAGKGVPIINSHFKPDRYEIWHEVMIAANELTKILTIDSLPEVGTNIGYAIESAKDYNDVCAITGRIVRVGRNVKATGHAEFGASKHIARIILAANKFNPHVRSAANLKYKEKNLHRARSAGFRIGSFERKKQPKRISTMEWGTTQAIQDLGRMPDIIYDLGEIGKEPMIRVLGRNPQDVLKKVRRLMRGGR